jgi:hypothetical protein
MGKKGAWVVSWLAIEAHAQASSSSQPRAPRREQAAFDNQVSAISFAMDLAPASRRSEELHMPGGKVVGIHVIEQMHDEQEI